MMTLRHVASYSGVLGLAAQSAQYRASMNGRLILMAGSAARATELGGASGRDRAEAAELGEKSEADRAEGVELEERAAELRAKAEEDEASAAADEAAGEALADRAEEDEAEAGAHLAAAAEDEAIRDADVAEGAAEAAAAAESEAEALEDAAAVAACEFIPFLDVVCDAVGALAEIGLASAAATQAAESAAEFAAAAAADEEAELARAAELQAEAAAEGAEAAGLEERAAEEEARAEAELAEAEREGAAAEAKFDESAEESAQAAEEEGRADAEEGGAAESWEESMKHGLRAFWDAVLAAVTSFFALLFFSMRLLLRFVIPGASALVFTHIPNLARGGAAAAAGGLPGFGAALWKSRVSHVVLHCAAFAWVLAAFADDWGTLSARSARSRGGAVIAFACLAGAAHSLVHHLPHHGSRMVRATRAAPDSGADDSGASERLPSKTKVALQFCWSIVRSFLFLAPLFGIEVLILWVNFGPHVFDRVCVSTLPPPVPWIAFTLCAGFHIWSLWPRSPTEELPEEGGFIEAKPLLSTKGTKSYTEEAQVLDEEENILYSETDVLLGDALNIDQSSVTDALPDRKTPSQGDNVCASKEKPEVDLDNTIPKRADRTETKWMREHQLHHLQLPFEVLMVSCAVALLASCAPKFHQLLPVFFSKFTSPAIKWYLPAAGVCFVAAFVAFFRCSHAPRRGNM